jgi:murein DD-endopeptidase MepM/ murein hydrolase activator NlpD
MRKNTMKTTAVAAGAGVALLLGSGVSGAADLGPIGKPDKTAETLAESTYAQADQAKKSAADHKAKKQDKPKQKPAWVSPVDKPYEFTGTYNQGGARWAAKHSGQDFAAPTGTPVKAVNSGTVVEAGWGGAYGNNIVIKHSNGKYTQYGHLSKMDVSVGQTVGTDKEIGKIGSTGNSSGPHLHFEVRTTPYYGSAVNPIDYLKAEGVKL